MIVHGVLSLDVGGLEHIVAALALHQKDAAIICVEDPGALAGGLHKQGVVIRTLHKPPGRDTKYRSLAEQVLQTLKPGVLHTHQIGAAWYLAPAAKRLGIRVVHTEHGNPFARAKSWWQRFKLRRLMRQAAKCIDLFACVSPDIADACRVAVLKEKIRVVPNGIRLTAPTKSRDEIRAALGIPRDAFVVGTVGRLSEVKRQDILLRALSISPEVWGLIVGDGEEHNNLQSLAQSLSISNRIVFAGYQPEPLNYLQAMDAFALTSRSEGFPVTLLEAWSLKLPVVVSNVGGLQSIVNMAHNGIVVPFGDYRLFSAAFQSLKQVPAYAVSLGAAGHAELLAKYTFDRMAGEYRRLYGE